MASKSIEDRLKQARREQSRDTSPSTAPSQPVNPPFLSDGPELVRDSHC
jgi:hypothetical protein